MKIPDANKQYKCAVCSKSFNSRYNLFLHVRISSRKNLLRSSSKVWSRSRCRFLSLIRQHSRDKLHECHTCTRTFNSKSNLIRHMTLSEHVRPQIHLGMGKAQEVVDDCGSRLVMFKRPKEKLSQEFSGPDNISQYIMVHSPIYKPFECIVCGLRFDCKSDVARHIQSHKPRRPNLCSLCHKSFKFESALARHFRKQHNGAEQMQESQKEVDAVIDERHTRKSSIYSIHKSYGSVPAPGDKNSNKRIKDCELVRVVKVSRLKECKEKRRKTFRCSRCGFVTDRIDNLCRHVKVKHKGCAILKRSGEVMSFTDDEFESEGIYHKQRSLIFCSLCGKSFLGRDALDRHVEKKHMETEQEQTYHKEIETLNHCDGSTRAKYNSDNYKDYKRSGINNSERENLAEEARVMKVFLKKGSKQSRKKMYKCSLCDYISDWTGHIYRHIKSYHKGCAISKISDEIDNIIVDESDSEGTNSMLDAELSRGKKFDINSSVGTSSKLDDVVSFSDADSDRDSDGISPMEEVDPNGGKIISVVKLSTRESQQVGGKAFYCSECGFMSDSVSSLYRHMRRYHKDCTIVTRTELRNKAKSNQIASVGELPSEMPGDISDEDQGGLASLESGERATVTAEKLSKEEIQNGGKMYKCTLCTYKSGWTSAIYKHQRIHHKGYRIVMRSANKCKKSEEEDRPKDAGQRNAKQGCETTPRKWTSPRSGRKEVSGCVGGMESSLRGRTITAELVPEEESQNGGKLYRCTGCGYTSNSTGSVYKHMRRVHKSCTIVMRSAARLDEDSSKEAIDHGSSTPAHDFTEASVLVSGLAKRRKIGMRKAANVRYNRSQLRERAIHTRSKEDVGSDPQVTDDEGEMSDSLHDETITAELTSQEEFQNDGKKYKCSKCGFKGQTTGVIYKHMRKKHKSCTIAMRSVIKSKNGRLDRGQSIREVTALPQSEYSSECDEDLEDAGSTMRSSLFNETITAELTSQEEFQNDGKKYKCSKCGLKGQTTSAVYRHMRKKHKSCTIAMRSVIKSKNGRLDRGQSAREITALPQSEYSSECEEDLEDAGSTMRSSLFNETITAELISQEEFQNDGKKYKCSKCGLKGQTTSSLYRHMRRKHKFCTIAMRSVIKSKNGRLDHGQSTGEATALPQSEDSSGCDEDLEDAGGTMMNSLFNETITAEVVPPEEVEDGRKTYQCSKCTYRSEHTSSVYKHQKIHHKECTIVKRSDALFYHKERSDNSKDDKEKNKKKSMWSWDDDSTDEDGSDLPIEESTPKTSNCISTPQSRTQQETADGANTFKCSSCDFMSNSASDIYKHMRHQHHDSNIMKKTDLVLPDGEFACAETTSSADEARIAAEILTGVVGRAVISGDNQSATAVNDLQSSANLESTYPVQIFSAEEGVRAVSLADGSNEASFPSYLREATKDSTDNNTATALLIPWDKRVDNVKIYKCSQCPYTTSCTGGIYKHIRRNHKSCSIIKRKDTVGYRMTRVRNWGRPNKDASIDEKGKQGQSLSCGKIITAELTPMEEMAAGSKAYKCSACNYTSDGTGAIYKHMILHHKDCTIVRRKDAVPESKTFSVTVQESSMDVKPDGEILSKAAETDYCNLTAESGTRVAHLSVVPGESGQKLEVEGLFPAGIGKVHGMANHVATPINLEPPHPVGLVSAKKEVNFVTLSDNTSSQFIVQATLPSYMKEGKECGDVPHPNIEITPESSLTNKTATAIATSVEGIQRGEKCYKCSECSYTSDTTGPIYRHIKRHHKDCTILKKSYLNYKAIAKLDE